MVGNWQDRPTAAGERVNVTRAAAVTNRVGTILQKTSGMAPQAQALPAAANQPN